MSDAPRRRIFIAYTLPAESASAVAMWAAGTLGAGELRVVPAANLHITLVFCGPVASERVEEVVERTRAGILLRRAPIYTPSRVRVLAR
ncbi:MAG TPA: 2'-5' RNA ligase family protein, partial [Gaiellales bacterium]|nr:2'-5' RNA ligase family protein [Gaiellales bacterium]